VPESGLQIVAGVAEYWHSPAPCVCRPWPCGTWPRTYCIEGYRGQLRRLALAWGVLPAAAVIPGGYCPCRWATDLDNLGRFCAFGSFPLDRGYPVSYTLRYRTQAARRRPRPIVDGFEGVGIMDTYFVVDVQEMTQALNVLKKVNARGDVALTAGTGGVRLETTYTPDRNTRAVHAAHPVALGEQFTHARRYLGGAYGHGAVSVPLGALLRVLKTAKDGDAIVEQKDASGPAVYVTVAGIVHVLQAAPEFYPLPPAEQTDEKRSGIAVSTAQLIDGIKAVAPAVVKDAGRYALNHLLIDATGTGDVLVVGADGSRLCVASISDHTGPATFAFSVLIPAAVFKAVQALKARNGAADTVHVRRIGKNRAALDCGPWSFHAGTAGFFPDYQAVIPTRNANAGVLVGSEQLAGAVATMTAGLAKSDHITAGLIRHGRNLRIKAYVDDETVAGGMRLHSAADIHIIDNCAADDDELQTWVNARYLQDAAKVLTGNVRLDFGAKVADAARDGDGAPALLVIKDAAGTVAVISPIVAREYGSGKPGIMYNPSHLEPDGAGTVHDGITIAAAGPGRVLIQGCQARTPRYLETTPAPDPSARVAVGA
jgi:hypothetical protein